MALTVVRASLESQVQTERDALMRTVTPTATLTQAVLMVPFGLSQMALMRSSETLRNGTTPTVMDSETSHLLPP